jgi:hypothetical protein
MSDLEFDPVETLASATRLDALADRLEGNLGTNRSALNVAPAGKDEVSLRAATTFTSVAESYDHAATDGILELRRLAANLRSQASGLRKMEDDNAASLGGAPGN